MIRLIALDIDGTLLDSRWHVPEANRQALAAAGLRGAEVVLVTGRRFEFTRPVLEQLSGPVTLILHNGALVKTRDGDTLMQYLLPVSVARRVLGATVPFRETTAVLFDRAEGPQVVYERLESPTARRARAFERNQQLIAAVDPLEAALAEDPVQLMYSGPVGQMRELLAVLRALPFVGDYTVSVTEYAGRDVSFVDVTRRGCSKGSTLAAWAASRGVRRAEIMAVGDNLNDRDMLEYAGVAVVMGNAVPELTEAGWHVTRTNDEAGVADAIRRFVLDSSSATFPPE